MGAGSSCPQGFEKGMIIFCRATCPDRFKYMQESGDPPGEYCVSMYDNSVKVKLRSLPMINPAARPNLTPYVTERARVDAEIKTATAQVEAKLPVADALRDAQSQMAANINAHSQIRTEFAKYTENFETVKSLVDSLKPLRPPTAPASDLAIERKAILESSAPNFLLIQVELAIVILGLLVYAFLPMEVAPGLTILLLSVGVAVGIFLWKV
jgi:hypothetical protein